MGIKKKVGITDVDAVTGKVFGSTYDVVKTVYGNLEMLEGLVTYIDKMPDNIKKTVEDHIKINLDNSIVGFEKQIDDIVVKGNFSLIDTKDSVKKEIELLSVNIKKEYDTYIYGLRTLYETYVKDINLTIMNVNKTLKATQVSQFELIKVQDKLSKFSTELAQKIPYFESVNTDFKVHVTKAEKVKRESNELWNEMLKTMVEYNRVMADHESKITESMVVLNGLNEHYLKIKEYENILKLTTKTLEEINLERERLYGVKEELEVFMEVSLTEFKNLVKEVDSINKNVQSNKDVEASIQALSKLVGENKLSVDGSLSEIIKIKKDISTMELNVTSLEQETAKTLVHNINIKEEVLEALNNVQTSEFNVNQYLANVVTIKADVEYIKDSVESSLGYVNSAVEEARVLNNKTEANIVRFTELEKVAVKIDSIVKEVEGLNEVSKGNALTAKEEADRAERAADKATSIVTGEVADLVNSKVDKLDITDNYNGSSNTLILSQLGASKLKINLEEFTNSKVTALSETFTTRINGIDSTILNLPGNLLEGVRGNSVSKALTQKYASEELVRIDSGISNLNNIVNGKQDSLSFTGTGNVARVSEVNKKLDITTYNTDKNTFSLKSELASTESKLNTAIDKKWDIQQTVGGGDILRQGYLSKLGLDSYVANLQDANFTPNITAFFQATQIKNIPSGVYNYGTLLNQYHGFSGESSQLYITHSDSANNDSRMMYRGAKSLEWVISASVEDVTKGLAKKWDVQQTSGSGNILREGAYGLGIGNTTTLDRYYSTLAGSMFQRYELDFTKDMPSELGFGSIIQTSYSTANFQRLYFPNYGKNPMYICRLANSVIQPIITIYGTSNTTVDSNGFIKAASPIIDLYANHIEHNDQFDKEPIFEKLGVGHYEISNTLGLAKGLEAGDWYIETPKDKNGSPYFNTEWQQLEDNTIIIRTYEREAFTEEYERYDENGNVLKDPNGNSLKFYKRHEINGEPTDIIENRFISLRFYEEHEAPEMPEESEEVRKAREERQAIEAREQEIAELKRNRTLKSNEALVMKDIDEETYLELIEEIKQITRRLKEIV